MNIVETKKLCKSYGTGDNTIDAINNIDLKIKQGEFIAIIGPSGSGKSTLLHLLGAVDKPTSGKVFIGGEDIYQYNDKQLALFRRRKVGFIFQFYNLIPVLSAKENIELPLVMDNRKIEKSYIDELIKILGLEGREDHLPSELSGGQQQRVSIGRALAYRPSIILADEPTGNLDSKNSREIIDLLKLSVKKYHQTLIIITHDLDIASQADRIISIEDGIISKDEVMNNEKYFF